MDKPKNKRTIIMAAILVGLLIVAYKTVFTSPSPADIGVSPDMAAASAVPGEGGGESILREIESINFDMSLMQNEKFKSLKSIVSPLISLPVGRKNPFSEI